MGAVSGWKGLRERGDRNKNRKPKSKWSKSHPIEKRQKTYPIVVQRAAAQKELEEKRLDAS